MFTGRFLLLLLRKFTHLAQDYPIAYVYVNMFCKVGKTEINLLLSYHSNYEYFLYKCFSTC